MLLDDAVLLMHPLQTEPRHLVELLKCADKKGDIYLLWQWLSATVYALGMHSPFVSACFDIYLYP